MADTALPDYYARRAAEYERIYAKPERQVELAQLKPLVRDYLTGRNVLEIACGTGYWTEVFAPQARSVTATDVNEEVLAIARTKTVPPGRVHFLKADAYAPEDVSGGVDAACAAFWWSHIPKVRVNAFLAALHARLPVGAHVLFMDNNYVPGSSTAISRTDGEGNSYQLRRQDSGETFEVLKNFPTETELRSAVAPYAASIDLRLLRYYWLLRFETAAR
jgi:demethylmenaquinone methyltransferase/2-methoxy-6-polyprenyl-1,4-benzoquinol methylase